MPALYLGGGGGRHAVVAQIVEAKFARSPVGYVCLVRFGLLGHILHIVYPRDGHSEKVVQISHPFGVALGEVFVYRDEVAAFAGQRIQIEGKGGYEGFAFAGCHFGNHILVEGYAAY